MQSLSFLKGQKLQIKKGFTTKSIKFNQGDTTRKNVELLRKVTNMLDIGKLYL